MTWKDDMSRFILAVIAILVFGFFVALLVIRVGSFDPAKVDKTLVGAIAGYLSSYVQSAYNYYFGSSSGSTGKDTTIAGQLKEGQGSKP